MGAKLHLIKNIKPQSTVTSKVSADKFLFHHYYSFGHNYTSTEKFSLKIIKVSHTLGIFHILDGSIKTLQYYILNSTYLA